MGPLALMALGAALGAAKSEFSDKPRAQRERKRDAELARWSPWTDLRPQGIHEPDLFGNVLQGGLTGAMMANWADKGGKKGSPWTDVKPQGDYGLVEGPLTDTQQTGLQDAGMLEQRKMAQAPRQMVGPPTPRQTMGMHELGVLGDNRMQTGPLSPEQQTGMQDLGMIEQPYQVSPWQQMVGAPTPDQIEEMRRLGVMYGPRGG